MDTAVSLGEAVCISTLFDSGIGVRAAGVAALVLNDMAVRDSGHCQSKAE